MTFEQFLTSRGLVESDLDADALTEQRAEYEREHGQPDPVPAPDPAPSPNPAPASTPDPDPSPVDPGEAARQAVTQERQRVNDIHAQGTENGIPQAVIERCQRDGLDLDGARQVFLAHLRERPPSVGSVSIHSRSSEDCDVAVLEAAISLRVGLPVASEALTRVTRRTHVDPEMAERADRFSDMSAIDICRHALALEGIRIPHTRNEIIRAAISTASLTDILANVQNKQLTQAFMESPNTARMWTRMTDVPDFKSNSRVRASESENLKKVNNGGEVEFGSVEDIKESFTVEQFAEMMVFTEQDIVNDDLNALSETPRKFAAAAARLESDKVYGRLLENASLNQNSNNLFSSGNSNLETGAGSALSAAQLAKLIEKLGLQTDIKGAIINILPVWFLYPPELWFLARQLVRSSEVRTSGSTDVADRGTNNPLMDVGLQTIQEPRLSLGTPAVGDTGAQSGSATAFYVFGDANQVPTFELAFIRGTGRSPRIEQIQLPANILGIGWRVVHSIGVGINDFRGMQKSDGA